jgi:hypothetical protein
VDLHGAKLMADPLIVALGRAVPIHRNVEAMNIAIEQTAGELEMRPDLSQPRLFWGARARKTISIYVPKGGDPIWVGGDDSVTLQTGCQIQPGVQARLLNYSGPIWIVAERGIPRAYVVET